MGPRRDIRGAVVVITGASSGIGKATALAFAGLGARLAVGHQHVGGVDPGTAGNRQALQLLERDWCGRKRHPPLL